MSWWFVGLLLLSAILLIRQAVTVEIDVLETHETRIRMISALLLVITGLVVHTSYFLVLYFSKPNLLVLLSVIISIYGLVSAAVCYLKIASPIFRDSKPYTSNSESHRDIQNILEAASSQLGLTCSPILRVWHTPNKSPQVVHPPFGHAIIVVPPNISKILRRLTEVTGIPTEILQRFLILHELSHLKNRDANFMVWTFAFLRIAKYIVLPLIILGVISVVANPAFEQIALLEIFLVVVCFGALLVVYRFVAQHREQLADSRALILLPARDAKMLTDSKIRLSGKELSALELLFLWFSEMSTYSVSHKQKRSAPVFLRHLLTKVTLAFSKFFSTAGKRGTMLKSSWTTHPSPKIRMETVRDRTFLHPNILCQSTPACIWIGFSSVVLLIFFALFASKLANGISYLLQTDRFSSDFHFAVMSCGYASVIYYVNLMFLIPLKNSISSIAIRVRDLLRILSKFYLAAVVGATTVVLAMGRLDEVFIIILIYSCALLFFLPLMSISVSFIAGRPFAFDETRESVPVFIVVFLVYCGLFFALLCFGIAAIDSLTIAGITSIILGVAAGLTVQKFAASVTDAFMSLRIGGWQIQFGGYSKGLIRWTLIADFALFLCLPMLVLSILFSRLFSYFGITFNRYIPSHVFVFILVIICLTAIGVGLLMMFGCRLFPKVTLDKIFHYSWITNALDIKSESSTITVSLRHIEYNKVPDGGFEPARGLRLSQMQATYYATIAQYFLTQGFQPSKKTIMWVLKCQYLGGGFGLWPQAAPRLCSTYEALTILCYSEQLSQVANSSHKAWVFQQARGQGGFAEPYRKNACLRDTFHALGSLELLGVSLSELRTKHDHWILEQWRAGKRDFASTYYCVMGLQYLNALSQEVVEEIESCWLMPYLPVMISLRPYKHIDKLYFYLSVAEKIYKGDKDRLKAMLFDLPERVKEDFSAFATVLPMEGHR